MGRGLALRQPGPARTSFGSLLKVEAPQWVMEMRCGHGTPRHEVKGDTGFARHDF